MRRRSRISSLTRCPILLRAAGHVLHDGHGYSISTVAAAQANLSALGIRWRIVAPLSLGAKQLVAGFLSCWLCSSVALSIALAYIRLACNVPPADAQPVAILAVIIASFMTSSAGTLLGAVPKLSDNTKYGLSTGISCTLSLFTGLYGGFAMQISDWIARNAPILGTINPAQQVTEPVLRHPVLRQLPAVHHHLHHSAGDERGIPLGRHRNAEEANVMNTCKATLRVLFAHRVYLMIYLVFIGILMMSISWAMMTSSSGSMSAVFESTKTRVAIIDRDSDRGDIATSMRAYLRDSSELVDLDDTSETLEQAVASNWLDRSLSFPTDSLTIMSPRRRTATIR